MLLSLLFHVYTFQFMRATDFKFFCFQYTITYCNNRQVVVFYITRPYANKLWIQTRHFRHVLDCQFLISWMFHSNVIRSIAFHQTYLESKCLCLSRCIAQNSNIWQRLFVKAYTMFFSIRICLVIAGVVSAIVHCVAVHAIFSIGL